MPGMNLGYPFDAELFLMQWRNAPDPYLTAMIESGAIVQDATIRGLIANGSDFFTSPIYDVLTGTPDNYDGVKDITISEPKGHHQSGVVYGRAHAWKDRDFIRDFNSGADPMRQITSQVSRFWQKESQKRMLGIVNGLFGITDDTYGYLDSWKNHTTTVATTSASVTEANKMGATTMGDAIQKAVGDNMDIFSLAWMHSKVATNLAGLQLLQFRKYTDASGIERQLKIADFNGITVIIDDNAPVKDSTSATGDKEYTTYVMGLNSILTAPAPVDTPVEIGRKELEGGGYNYYVTRFRECMHPNGFTYKLPTANYSHSPTDIQLADSANWLLSTDPKAIPMARIITNG